MDIDIAHIAQLIVAPLLLIKTRHQTHRLSLAAAIASKRRRDEVSGPCSERQEAVREMKKKSGAVYRMSCAGERPHHETNTRVSLRRLKSSGERRRMQGALFGRHLSRDLVDEMVLCRNRLAWSASIVTRLAVPIVLSTLKMQRVVGHQEKAGRASPGSDIIGVGGIRCLHPDVDATNKKTSESTSSNMWAC